jgi:hypothetical protein
MGGMMGGGGKGGGGGGGKSGSGNSPWDTKFAGEALQSNETAIHNRYAQLGLGIPGAGQSAAQAAASHSNLTAGGPSTMEQQDIGTIPTETGGAIGMANALLGQTFNPQTAAGLGPGGPISSLQQLAGQNQQNQSNADFSSGLQSTQST